MEETPQIAPEGFVMLGPVSPAADAWAPLYRCERADSVLLGTFIRKPLCNSRGTAHGGVIAALADYAMGQSYVTVYRAKLGELAGLATTQLSIDFIDPANMGTWLQIEPRTVHMGKTRGVMDAVITANGRTVGRANAAFRVVS